MRGVASKTHLERRMKEFKEFLLRALRKKESQTAGGSRRLRSTGIAIQRSGLRRDKLFGGKIVYLDRDICADIG
jgi:hypothetical protein